MHAKARLGNSACAAPNYVGFDRLYFSPIIGYQGVGMVLSHLEKRNKRSPVNRLGAAGVRGPISFVA